jgi:hypothetical protein
LDKALIWILLLAGILGAWVPLNFSAELATTLPLIGMRGVVAVVELIAHGAAAALSVSAGYALWLRRPHGPMLARAALVINALVAIQRHYWSILPTQTMPGDELWLSIAAVVHSAVWLVFLHRSARARAMAS